MRREERARRVRRTHAHACASCRCRCLAYEERALARSVCVLAVCCLRSYVVVCCDWSPRQGPTVGGPTGAMAAAMVRRALIDCCLRPLHPLCAVRLRLVWNHPRPRTWSAAKRRANADWSLAKRWRRMLMRSRSELVRFLFVAQSAWNLLPVVSVSLASGPTT